jgi:hypothetical protein
VPKARKKGIKQEKASFRMSVIKGFYREILKRLNEGF